MMLLAGAGLACAPAVPAQLLGDKTEYERELEERTWKDAEVRPPAYPREENLLEFHASPARGFRFYIDAASLSVGAEGVVRYVLVARSASGARNTTFEGMRCKAGSLRIYAVGHSDGTWSGRPGEWRSLGAGSAQYWHRALARDYFCPMGGNILSRDEGIDALQRGGHPLTGINQLR